jgi:hypothetical protein
MITLGSSGSLAGRKRKGEWRWLVTATRLLPPPPIGAPAIPVAPPPHTLPSIGGKAELLPAAPVSCPEQKWTRGSPSSASSPSPPPSCSAPDLTVTKLVPPSRGAATRLLQRSEPLASMTSRGSDAAALCSYNSVVSQFW